MASRRLHGVTTVTDGDSSVEDAADDSASLRAFTAELDEIAKALEDDARQFRERVDRAAQPAAARTVAPPPERVGGAYRTPPALSANRGSEGRSRLTATAGSPQRTYNRYSATPTMTSNGGETVRTRLSGARSVLHDDDGVPTPMQTPAPLMFSPLIDSESKTNLGEFARSHRRQSRGGESESKVSWEDTLLNTINSRKKPLSAARGGENRTAATGSTPSMSTYSKSKPVDDTHTYVLDVMRDTIERQEDRIHGLERENDMLKARVRELEAEVGYLDLQRQHPSPLRPPDPVPYSSPLPHRESYPAVPPPPQTAPFYRHYATPPRESSERRLPKSSASSSSPGSRFVQDLARHIDVDPMYHHALSEIMDEHFARVAQLRRQREWDDYY